MVSPVHLFPMQATCVDLNPGRIYTAGAPLLIPLGTGLVTSFREQLNSSTPRLLTTDDLVNRDATINTLWAKVAWEMLSTLGRLTTIHGTALRHRGLGKNVREIGVLDDAFPAAGLIAHRLLMRPLARLLGSDSQVSITSSGRLLVPRNGTDPLDHDQLAALVHGEICSPLMTITGNSSRVLLQKETVGALQ